MKKVSLIAVYLGRLPHYSSLSFKSAGYNSDIEFLIFTDQSPPSIRYANLRFIKIDRQGFEQLASKKLGHAMRLPFTRKLCDYKPAYGALFSDYVRGSSYWGHVDLDIVWGNIAKYLREPLSRGIRMISSDGRRISGPFTIYENSRDVVQLFREIPDLIAKLNADASLDLDEREFDGVAKASGISLLMRSFHVRREISRDALRQFLADEAVFQQVVTGFSLPRESRNRLPALWRSGEMWNILPPRRSDAIRLGNSMFVHLTTGRVSFTVDFENDLILPVRRPPPAGATTRTANQCAGEGATLPPIPRTQPRKPRPLSGSGHRP